MRPSGDVRLEMTLPLDPGRSAESPGQSGATPSGRAHDAADRNLVGWRTLPGPPDLLPVDVGTRPDRIVPSCSRLSFGNDPFDELRAQGPRVDAQVVESDWSDPSASMGNREGPITDIGRSPRYRLRGGLIADQRDTPVRLVTDHLSGEGHQEILVLENNCLPGVVDPRTPACFAIPACCRGGGLGHDSMLILNIEHDPLVGGRRTVSSPGGSSTRSTNCRIAARCRPAPDR